MEPICLDSYQIIIRHIVFHLIIRENKKTIHQTRSRNVMVIYYTSIKRQFYIGSCRTQTTLVTRRNNQSNVKRDKVDVTL